MILTCQRCSAGRDSHGHDHAGGGHAVPEHAHADAEREERQAALEDHVHGQAETPQGPERQRRLKSGQDADRSEVLRTQDTIRRLEPGAWNLQSNYSCRIIINQVSETRIKLQTRPVLHSDWFHWDRKADLIVYNRITLLHLLINYSHLKRINVESKVDVKMFYCFNRSILSINPE